MSDIFKPSNSFEIENSKGFYWKLCEEYEDFDKSHINPRFAINAAITSWHLTDWTYQEFFKSDSRFQDSRENGKGASGLTKYQHYLKSKCPELEYMRQITNGAKHCKIKQEFRTEMAKGDFAPYDFNRKDFDVPRFVIITEKEEELDFETLLFKTIEFWRSYLEDLYV